MRARRPATLLNRIAFRFETGGKRAAEVIHRLRLLGLRVGLRIVLIGIVSRRLGALPSNRAQGCADSGTSSGIASNRTDGSTSCGSAGRTTHGPALVLGRRSGRCRPEVSRIDSGFRFGRFVTDGFVVGLLR